MSSSMYPTPPTGILPLGDIPYEGASLGHPHHRAIFGPDSAGFRVSS